MLTPLIAVLASLGVLFFFADLFGLTRRSQLPDAPRTGILGGYLENLRTDIVAAGIEDMSPERFTAYSLIGSAVFALLSIVFTPYGLLGACMALLLATIGIRGFYIGRAAAKRRLITTRQVADAAREMSDALDSGESPVNALNTYANRAKPGAASEQITGEANLVAKSLLSAIHQRDARGAKQEIALRNAAEQLGNRYFIILVETFIQNVEAGGAQLSAGLRRVGTEVDYTLALRDKRITSLKPIITSYQSGGGILIFIVVATQLMSPDITAFFASLVGQILLIVGTMWWYTGFYLLRRNLDDRI